MPDQRSDSVVPVEKLRWRCKPDLFDFETTSEIPFCDEIIGQERATKAIQLGLGVASRGYNIYVQGLTGTGKKTTVKCLLEQVATDSRIPDDKCYVHNFDDDDRPIILSLPAGQGSSLRREMESLVNYLNRTVPAVLESEEFQKRRKQIVEMEGKKGREVIHPFEEKIKKENFVLMEIRYGPMTKTEIAPLVDGKPRGPEDLEKMLAEGAIERDEFDRIQEVRDALGEELQEVLKQAKEVEQKIGEALKNLVFGFGAEIVNPRIEALKKKYTGEKTSLYFEGVRHHVLENMDQFVQKPQEGGQQAGLAAMMPQQQNDPFLVYRVNVLVDNLATKKTPIIVETHPTYKNLFGTIERTWDRSGHSYTDFTHIRAGSLLMADGGYLVVSLIDLLAEPGVYQALKRSMKNNTVDIQGFDPYFLFSSTALKPEPVDVDVKVVVIGDSYSYQVLYNHDEDFKKIFKIKADFDTVMKRDKESVNRYAGFVGRIVTVENLLPFDRGAVAAVVEQGVRQAGRQSKLSTQFSDVADVLREATYWAKEVDSDVVKVEHVDRAISERVDRLNLVETKISEFIRDEVILIEIDGVKVGQVNGLAVYDMGDYSFGRPSKITAIVATGREGIINIEREADLSGKTHNKGMLILAGYLRSRFARKRPLTLSASVAFEQSYSGVDGDSASSTELYVVLSALSEVPIRQDIAVTGSVNQKGEVQAIGGVNQKVEGFYDTCRLLGLNGKQGVMIPASNVDELMLRKDIVKAVEEGKFKVYSVRNIEEGIEILTGVAAGERDDEGNFPEESIFGKVEARLDEMAQGLRDFMKGQREDEEGEKESEASDCSKCSDS